MPFSCRWVGEEGWDVPLESSFVLCELLVVAAWLCACCMQLRSKSGQFYMRRTCASDVSTWAKQTFGAGYHRWTQALGGRWFDSCWIISLCSCILHLEIDLCFSRDFHNTR